MRSDILDIKRLFKTVKKNAKYIPLLAAVDMVFFFLAGYVFMTYQLRIIEILQGISQSAKVNMALLENTTRGSMISMMESQKAIMGQLNQVFYLLIIMVVLLYVIYNITQCFNFAFTLSKLKKINLMKYLFRFVIFNMIATLVLGFVIYGYFRFSVVNKIDMLSVFSQGFLNWFFIIMLLVILFFIYSIYKVLYRVKAKTLLEEIFVLDNLLKFGLSLIFLVFFAGIYFWIFFTGFVMSSLVYLILVLLPIISVLRFYMLE